MGASLGILLSFLAAYFPFVAGHNIAFLWVLALLSFVFAGYRAWVKERQSREAAEFDLKRPRLTGFFRDATTQFIYEDEHSMESAPTGTCITVVVHIVNENPIPTNALNFTLMAEARDKQLLARYPEEQIKRSRLGIEVAPPEIIEHEKRMTNLVTYLNDHSKQFTQGAGIEGYLTFNFRGFGLPDELKANGVAGWVFRSPTPLYLTLGIEDGFGKYHYIDTWGNRPRPGHGLDEPSDRTPYTKW